MCKCGHIWSVHGHSARCHVAEVIFSDFVFWSYFCYHPLLTHLEDTFAQTLVSPSNRNIHEKYFIVKESYKQKMKKTK